MAAHALLSPSAAERWINCPASVYISRDIPDEGSVYADEGTAAHTLMELAGKDYFNGFQWDAIQTTLAFKVAEMKAKGPQGKFTITDAWADEVINCAHVWIKELDKVCGGFPDYVAFETRVNSVEIPNGSMSGTADCLMLVGDTLHVFDYKHGQGVPVSAENNPQLSLYGYMAYTSHLDLPVKNIELHIVQPRADNTNSWKTSVEELCSWFDEIVQPQAERVIAICETGKYSLEDFAVTKAGCRFCKAKAACPAMTREVSTELDLPRVLTVPDSPEKLSRLLDFKPVAEAYFDAVEKKVFDLLSNGQSVPGFKLVSGRPGNRKWTDSAQALDELKKAKLKMSEYYKAPEVISPTQAEKLYKSGVIGERKWQTLQGLITRPEGKPTLAAATDKRPALKSDADYLTDES